MTFAEALDYLTGQDRRHRQQWETTRMLANVVSKTLTGEVTDCTFPWDDESEPQEETTEEDLARLRAMARAAEAAMNKQIKK